MYSVTGMSTKLSSSPPLSPNVSLGVSEHDHSHLASNKGCSRICGWKEDQMIIVVCWEARWLWRDYACAVSNVSLWGGGDKRLKVSHTAHTTDKGGQQHRKGCSRARCNQLTVCMSHRREDVLFRHSLKDFKMYSLFLATSCFIF